MIVMATELNKDQFVEILLDRDITRLEDLAIFQTIYSFDGHKAYASEVGVILGVKSKNPAGAINLQIGRLAKRIASKHDIDFSIRQSQQYKYWDLFFNGWSEKQYWVWELKVSLRLALEEADLTGETLYSLEIPKNVLGELTEGAKTTITINAYERSTKARNACIAHYGTTCCVCGFDFEKVYGEIGKGFTHVHHIKRLADIAENYIVDPINDLRPVCPNCHSMLHRDKD